MREDFQLLLSLLQFTEASVPHQSDTGELGKPLRHFQIKIIGIHMSVKMATFYYALWQFLIFTCIKIKLFPSWMRTTLRMLQLIENKER